MATIHIAPDIGYLFNAEFYRLLCGKEAQSAFTDGEFVGLAGNLNPDCKVCEACAAVAASSDTPHEGERKSSAVKRREGHAAAGMGTVGVVNVPYRNTDVNGSVQPSVAAGPEAGCTDAKVNRTPEAGGSPLCPICGFPSMSGCACG